MPAPPNVTVFLDLVRKSGVVDPKRLDEHLEKLRADKPLPDDVGQVAGYLVRDGLLTHFQAEQVLLGKWRRFTIGKYKVLERLGIGGMGSVYLCEHKFMRRPVAVKVLPANKADDPASLDRFYREARAVAALDHPNIVRAYDIDQDEKLHFLVMEFVDGTSLQEIVKGAGPMDIHRVAHYIAQSATGLDHAFQAAGLIHRDVKPGNLLVDRNGFVKILDMGLARFFHDTEDNITRKYDENVLGTADYLSPEQALDSHNVDIRTDIYSLGATMYFMLTGNTPFSDGTVAQKLIWHQTKEPTSVREVRPEIPEEMEAVLTKMMAKKPEDRFQSPRDIVEALATWTQEPIDLPPEHEMPRLSPAAMKSIAAFNQAGMAAVAPGTTAARRHAPPASVAVASAPRPVSQASTDTQQSSNTPQPAKARVQETPTPPPAVEATDEEEAEAAEPESTPPPVVISAEAKSQAPRTGPKSGTAKGGARTGPGSGTSKAAPASGTGRTGPGSGVGRAGPGSGTGRTAPGSGTNRAGPKSGTRGASPKKAPTPPPEDDEAVNDWDAAALAEASPSALDPEHNIKPHRVGINAWFWAVIVGAGIVACALVAVILWVLIKL